MDIDELVELREKVNRSFMDAVTSNLDVRYQFTEMDDAMRTIEVIASQGGSLRAHGESKIVELVKLFDTTRGSSPWPLSAYLMGLEDDRCILEAEARIKDRIVQILHEER